MRRWTHLVLHMPVAAQAVVESRRPGSARGNPSWPHVMARPPTGQAQWTSMRPVFKGLRAGKCCHVRVALGKQWLLTQGTLAQRYRAARGARPLMRGSMAAQMLHGTSCAWTITTGAADHCHQTLAWGRLWEARRRRGSHSAASHRVRLHRSQMLASPLGQGRLLCLIQGLVVAHTRGPWQCRVAMTTRQPVEW